MTRALYNRDTIARIRGLTGCGDGVHAIARDLEWTAEEVRTVAKRHGIPIIEDNPERKPKPASAVAPTPARPEPVKPAPIEKRPLPPRAVTAGRDGGGTRIRRDHTEYPRGEYVTMALSKAGIKALDKIVKHTQYNRSSIIGVTVDYLARTGKIQVLFDEAMAEGK